MWWVSPRIFRRLVWVKQDYGRDNQGFQTDSLGIKCISVNGLGIKYISVTFTMYF